MGDPGRLAVLREGLPGLDWVVDEALLARLSQDFSWFSPVLKRQLSGLKADLAVRPHSQEELAGVVSACARLGVPITVRGSGTGNYGQCTPLQGGVIVDMTAMNRVVRVGQGTIRAEAGARLAALETAARPMGLELRCMPSTYKVASVGGLFAGGFGGVGSINHGPLGSPGNILGVRVMGVAAEPEVVDLHGQEAVAQHHLWGTTGILVEVELALAPAQPWIEWVVTFSDAEDALSFADRMAAAPGLVKREVALMLDPVPRYLPGLAEALPEGEHAVLAAVAEVSEDAFCLMAADHRGAIRLRQDEEQARRSRRTLLEFCWNHTTLHALKVDPTLTYLQNSFTPGLHLQQVKEMRALFGDEVLWHLEFIRSFDGLPTCTALPLVRFQGEDRLNAIIDTMRAHGVRVNNPHVNTVEDGKFGGVLPPAVMALKQRFDPQGLLNPGKLRSWPAAS